jgi:hypothetical protein
MTAVALCRRHAACCVQCACLWAPMLSFLSESVSAALSRSLSLPIPWDSRFLISESHTNLTACPDGRAPEIQHLVY